MRDALKLLTVCASAAAALVLSAPALAAYTTPTIRVDNPSERIAGPASPVTVNLTVAREDDPTARIVLYIPQGYTGTLTPAAGTQIGTVRASASPLASPEVVLPLEGVLRADAPANYVGPATQCLGPAPNFQSVWLIVLNSPTGGAPIVVPTYLTTPLGAAEGSVGQARLTICLPPPAVGTLAAKVFEARLTLTNILTNPSAGGSYRWVARFTPYASNAGPVNPAGTVEAQAIDTIPVRVTIRRPGRYTKRTKRLAVSGTIVESGTPLRVVVNVLLNGRRVARVRSNARGAYRASIRIPRRGRYTLRATASSGARTVQGCTAVLTPAVPCTRTVISGFTVTSANVRVRVR